MQRPDLRSRGLHGREEAEDARKESAAGRNGAHEAASSSLPSLQLPGLLMGQGRSTIASLLGLRP
jgi:hypothetical protein